MIIVLQISLQEPHMANRIQQIQKKENKCRERYLTAVGTAKQLEQKHFEKIRQNVQPPYDCTSCISTPKTNTDTFWDIKIRNNRTSIKVVHFFPNFSV